MISEGALEFILAEHIRLGSGNVSRGEAQQALRGPLGERLEALGSALRSKPTVIEGWPASALEAFCELRVAQVLLAHGRQQREIRAKLEKELKSLLTTDGEKTRRAAGRMVGALLLAMDELPRGEINRVLEMLSSLTGRHEGVIPGRFSEVNTELSPDARLDLSKILDAALFAEVFAFLRGMPHLQRATTPRELKGLRAGIVAIASRKGGVGKSTVALATALSLLRDRPDSRVCLVDFDITGPIWQYLLCPDGRGTTGEPIPFMNGLIHFDESDESLFGPHRAAQFLRCVAPVRIPATRTDIGLLTFADLPRTNRHLVQVIGSHREAFTRFLVSLLKALDSRFDYIVFDNTPGLDPHPLLTLAIAGVVKTGLPIILSTPHVPDLRGTLLEISDLRLLNFRRQPLWVINKADDKTQRFLEEKLTLIDIAELSGGYQGIMPEAPALKNLLTPHDAAMVARPLPFDVDLARPNIADFAKPLTSPAVETFQRSNLFKQLSIEIAENLGVPQQSLRG